MLYVIRAGGHQVDELPDAVATVTRGNDLVCLDERGNEVSRYNRLTVSMFGRSEQLKVWAAGKLDGRRRHRGLRFEP